MTKAKGKESGNNFRENGKIIMLAPESIVRNPNQPRRVFNEQKLSELAHSIIENGMIHPITITLREGIPTLVAGERRLKAAQMANLEEVACVAVAADDFQLAVLTLVENLQRESLGFFEEAEGIAKLIEMYHITQSEAANKLGMNQSTVANKLRLLKLSEDNRALIEEGELTERHARALLRFEDEILRSAALSRFIRDELTASQADKLVDEWLSGNIKRKKTIPLVRDVRIFLNTFNNAISTMIKSGIKAVSEKKETDDFIEYTVRIPKAAVGRADNIVRDRLLETEPNEEHLTA